MTSPPHHTQLASYLTALDYMIRVINYRDSRHIRPIYDVLTQLFLYLVLGIFPQTLMVSQDRVTRLDTPLHEKEDLILPLATPDDYKNHPQLVFSDSRFIQFNQYNLHNRRVLEDYLKLTRILASDEPVASVGAHKEHWGGHFWGLMHLITVAADTYLNQFWLHQRGQSLQEIKASDAYAFYESIADALFLFFSTYLPLSIPCEPCEKHYLSQMGDFYLLNECIYQVRTHPTYLLSDYFYYIHNSVNADIGAPTFPMELFKEKKQSLVDFIDTATRAATDAFETIPITQSLPVAEIQNGTHLSWFKADDADAA